MYEKRLSKKAIVVWRIRYTLLTLLLCFFLGGIGVFKLTLSLLLLTLLIIFYFFITYCYIKLRYNNTYYHLGKHYLKIKKGVFFVRKFIIELKKIQYITILQTPEQKVLMVSTIIIHTTGKKISLSQVDFSEALAIKQHIYGELL